MFPQVPWFENVGGQGLLLSSVWLFTDIPCYLLLLLEIRAFALTSDVAKEHWSVKSNQHYWSPFASQSFSLGQFMLCIRKHSFISGSVFQPLHFQTILFSSDFWEWEKAVIWNSAFWQELYIFVLLFLRAKDQCRSEEWRWWRLLWPFLCQIQCSELTLHCGFPSFVVFAPRV